MLGWGGTGHRVFLRRLVESLPAQVLTIAVAGEGPNSLFILNTLNLSHDS